MCIDGESDEDSNNSVHDESEDDSFSEHMIGSTHMLGQSLPPALEEDYAMLWKGLRDEYLHIIMLGEGWGDNAKDIC
ncbi:hypothetical protein Moror_12215 [Moniliophthora roreri MCA 2997]|uniref:Uncharacterized protein n=1 Tax=Moniliophthora roreri (strain MCA 2997) TaxID=1381753 RepID=V2XSE3_MONRO|nr:hypothetical protein Moror_12215 [Moniliophthora roreri MCA 2997]